MWGRAIVVTAALLAACDSLPPAQDGVCGNKVVDPTEDCDGFGNGENTLCRKPGEPGECRFACGLQADGSSPVCPAGMGCGNDGTCRASDGTFVAATQPLAGDFGEVLVGDIDGDGRADVVGLEPTTITVNYFDSTLASVTTVVTPRRENEPMHPLLRDLSGDGRADLVVSFGNGTIVELGSAAHEPVPLAFPSTHFAGLSHASIIVLGTVPPYEGQTVFVMGSIGTLSGIALLDVAGQGAAFAFLPDTPDKLAGPIAVGHLVEDPAVSPCDELALIYKGGSDVDVFSACGPDGKGGFAFNDYVNTKTPTLVHLPAGATAVRGPVLLDVNGDGHLDFLVGASRNGDEVEVAYGVGDGTFNADPDAIPTSNGDDTFSTYPLVTGPLPLAMGDLNGDGVPDQVTPTQVLVSQKSGTSVTFVARGKGHGAPWTEAAIADFTHDGVLDVAAGSSATPNLDFFVGAGGGLLDPFLVQSGPVRNFTVGDFDGDLVEDLAVSEVAPSDDPLGDSVSILFGNPAGALDPPIGMGRFVNVSQTTAGKFVDGYGVLSGTDVLLTTSEPDATTTNFGSFAGAGDRLIRSPFTMATFTSTTSVASARPERYALGHFTSATGPLDLAALDDQNFPVPQSPAHRLWLLPTDGFGRFVVQTSKNLDPVPDGIDWSRVAIVAVDLDGSGTDQLVALGPSSADPTQGAVAIARTAPGPSTDPPTRLVFDAPAPADAVVSRDESDPDPHAESGRVLATDLDGDGRPDVVALASVAGTPSVVVFWNDHGGALGAMTVVPNPNGHAPIDFATVQAGGAGPSLAILTDEGVTLASFAQRSPSVASSAALHLDGGRRLAAGDVDGDGVEDLAVASDTGIVVYRGNPVRP